MTRHLDTMTWEELCDHNVAQAKKANFPFNMGKFKEYLMQLEPIGNLFDYQLKGRCFSIRNKLQKDYDHVICIHSKEGWGKSTLSIQLACYINPNWDLSFMCFTLEDIITAFKKAKIGDVIIIDEGSINLFSRESMSKANKILAKLFMIGRQKNLCIIINIPNFHLLDTYIRDHRVDTLIALKERGRYIAYIGRAIRRISRLGSKFKEVVGIKVADGTFFEGYHVKEFPKTIDRQEYLERKKQHLLSFVNDLEKEQDVERNYVSIQDMANLLNCSQDKIRDKVREGKIPGEKIFNRWYIRKEAHDDYKRTLNGEKNAQ